MPRVRERVEVFGVTPGGKVLGGFYPEDKTFGVFGGGIDPGETPVEAARREFFEESGRKIYNVRLLPVKPLTQSWKEPTVKYDDPKYVERLRQFPDGHRTYFVTGDLAEKERRPAGVDVASRLKSIKLRPIEDMIEHQNSRLSHVEGPVAARVRSRMKALQHARSFLPEKVKLSYTMYESMAGELEKISARAGVKMLRALMARGEEGAARALAKRLSGAGALKVSGPGTNIKRLGTGAESVADVVVGAKAAPQGELAVRKALDPRGPLFSREGVGEKVQAYRRARSMGLEDQFAKLYGKVGKGAKGGRYLTTEYVPQSSGWVGTVGEEAALRGSLRSPQQIIEGAKARGVTLTPEQIAQSRAQRTGAIQRHLQSQGADVVEATARAQSMVPRYGGPRLGDLHYENVRMTPSGQMKILDFTTPQPYRSAQHIPASPRVTGTTRITPQAQGRITGLEQTMPAAAGTAQTATRVSAPPTIQGSLAPPTTAQTVGRPVPPGSTVNLRAPQSPRPPSTPAEFESRMRSPGAKLMRQRQMAARGWAETTGVQPLASSIGVTPTTSGPVIGGLSAGPKSGPQAIKRSLVGLGGGSRQLPKVRGFKPPSPALAPSPPSP